MKFLIQTVYPSWFIILCIIAGLAYSAILYFKNDFSSGKSAFSFPNIMMAIFRFLAVSLICFFLLSPFITKNIKRIESPVIVIATDNSESILLNKDSNYYNTQFRIDLEKLIDELSKKYEVQIISFGNEAINELRTTFEDSRTNISELLEYIYEQNFNRNLGAIVMASDGNYNEGRNPISLIKDFNAPIYTIALGDTSIRKDAIINDVKSNSIAYLGNKFPIQVKVEAKKCSNSKAKIKVYGRGKILLEEEILIGNENYLETINFLLEAKEPGLQKFVITLTKLQDEISYSNNTKTIFIDVLENRKNILILANSTHPDIAAIKRSIRKNDNYKVNSSLITTFVKHVNDLDAELGKYDMLILHQLPGTNYKASKLFEIIDTKRIPTFFILGTQSSINNLNTLDLGLKIIQKRKNFNSVLPLLSNDFNYFNISENVPHILREYPPLTTPFGKYQISGEFQIALTQKIGQVDSKYPLLVFIHNLDNRIGVLSGEGIWKWPLIESKVSKEQKIFDELINKTVQFLSTKADKRFFRLIDFKNLFFEDQPVTFEAEVYNQSYENFNGAKINMEITDETGKNYSYLFQETEDGYSLDAGYFKAGKYKFIASTVINGKDYSLSGIFSVRTIDIEYLNTVANHNLLYKLSKEREGEMFYPSEIDQLIEKIADSDIKPTYYFDKETKDLIEHRWLLFIIIFLLAIEWFFRKFFGSY